MIVRAPVVVTMNGAPIIDGAVRIEGDRISQVGEFSAFTTSPDARDIIELDSCILLPGLINTHCHLDYTCLRGKIPPQNSFADWIRAINAEKARLTESDYLQSIADGFREAQRFGTTSILNLEAFPNLIARSGSAPLRTWWCAELIDVTVPERACQIADDAIAKLHDIKRDGDGIGLAPHAPFTASAELFRRCQQIAAAEDCLLTTHLAESREEKEMFRDGAGSLFEFLRSLGRDASDCGSATPLQRFLKIIRDPSTPKAFRARDDRGVAITRWIVAHLNELTKDDFNLLEQLPEKFSIAHCPRSHPYFRHAPFAFERLRDLGFNICLATDSLASNADLSLFAEMREFQKVHDQIPARDLLEMVTVNPARALGRAREVGKIAPGYLGDMIALPFDDVGDVYKQIIAFEGDVPWMMIGGHVL